jgi:hypothetical protein
MITINRAPSARELAWFGALLGVFFGLAGAVVRWKVGAPGAARVLWIVAVILPAAYYAVPPLRRPLYLGWTCAAFPVGFAVSYLVLAAAYYLVITPIGLLARLAGRDVMRRRFDPGAPTYWVEHRSASDPARYLRQF